MEVLESLTSILIDIVKNVKFDDGKQAFIREHIKNALSDTFPSLHFPPGKDWFNVFKPLTEADLKGKVVVLDFFTYCCINCLHILPHLKKLEEKFSVEDGLVVIGVHSAKFENEKKSSNIGLALKKLNVTHPVVNDSDGFLWNRMRIFCWPTIVIIGPTGHPLFTLTGEQHKDELFLFVESTLNFYAGEVSPHPLPICVRQEILTSSILCFPTKITRFGNIFAVSDSGNHRILVIDEKGCVKFKIGGKSRGFQDGSFADALFNSPQGLAFYNEHKLFVADTENHAIRMIDLTKMEVQTVVGTGVQGTSAKGGKLGKIQEISSPWDLCFVSADHIHIACNNVGVLPPDSGRVHKHPYAFSLPPPPPPLPFTYTLPSSSACAAGPSSAPFGECATALYESDAPNNVLLIAMCGTHQIWALFLEDTIWWKGTKYRKNVCVAIAGSGKEENRNNTYPMLAAFAQPSGLAYSPSHGCVFIADSESSSIRMLSLEDGSVSHVAGGDRNPVNLFHFGDVDGRGLDAKLQHPLGLTFSERENMLYVCDSYNNKLKKIDMTTLDCTSTDEESNLFNEPSGCVLDEAEEVLYIADTNNHCIAMYNLNDKTLKNWVIEEEPEEDPNVKYDEEWELETEMSNNGGLLTLVIHLGPEDISGTWKLDLKESTFETKNLEGKISSEPQELVLKIPADDPDNKDTAKIIFTVKFCGKDVCIAKKCLLTLLVKRNENGEEFKNLEFEKTITQ